MDDRELASRLDRIEAMITELHENILTDETEEEEENTKPAKPRKVQE